MKEKAFPKPVPKFYSLSAKDTAICLGQCDNQDHTHALYISAPCMIRTYQHMRARSPKSIEATGSSTGRPAEVTHFTDHTRACITIKSSGDRLPNPTKLPVIPASARGPTAWTTYWCIRCTGVCRARGSHEGRLFGTAIRSSTRSRRYRRSAWCPQGWHRRESVVARRGGTATQLCETRQHPLWHSA